MKCLHIRYECANIFLVINMEKRIAKIISGATGGTASKSSKTYKISIPNKWVSELGLADDFVELHYDGEKIIISRQLSLEEFARRKKAAGHSLKLIVFYNGEELCTKICVDFTDESVAVENYTDNIVKTAFGNNTTPTWKDFQAFLEERCVPRSRSGIREYLESIGVDSYDPLLIVEKTGGRMAEDNQWIRMEGYNDN